MKLDVLAIGVHPDDIELGCGGTIIKHVKDGLKVGLCDLTQGELGTRGNGPLRLEEAETARVIMGAVVRENLGMRDAFFQINEENIIKLARVIRKYRPEVVLCNAVSDRHPDHGRASKLASEACFYAGLSKIEIDGLERWRPKTVYKYIQDRFHQPDFVIDVTDHIDLKMESILAYRSQFFDPESSELSTPISGQDFLDYVKAKDRVMGRPLGLKYAEGFMVERTIGVNSLLDIF